MLPATTPPPPYTAVVFTSVRAANLADGYAEAAEAMESLARDRPGFLGIESARGEDGLGITVSYWTSPEAAREWKTVAEHVAVQRIGRERWYAAYRVRVATVDREYGHEDGHEETP